MKTAVSIPDDVYEDAERLARRMGTSRSRLYADALREYMARLDPDSVTETLNRLVDEDGCAADPAFATATARTLQRVEW